MTTPFRIAFLGIDNPHGAAWRELFYENFRDEIEITAIVPGFEDGTTSLEERLTGVDRFKTVESLIEEGSFDGAFIGLPNNEAPAAAAKLASVGKHILMEKPCAGSADDFRPVVEAANQSGVAFQSGFMWRYDEGANRIRDMIADGRFGKLISVEMTMVTSDVKKRDPSHYLFDREVSTGGFFSWLASHYLDLLAYLTGQSVKSVTARTGVFGDTPTEVEDGGIAVLDLEGGGMATFLGGYWIPRWAGEGHWTIRGSERWVHWTPGQKLEVHGPQPQWNAMEEVFDLPVDATKGYGGARAVETVRDWIAAAREGGRPCRNTPESTLDTLSLIDRIYRASREGRTLTLQP